MVGHCQKNEFILRKVNIALRGAGHNATVIASISADTRCTAMLWLRAPCDQEREINLRCNCGQLWCSWRGPGKYAHSVNDPTAPSASRTRRSIAVWQGRRNFNAMHPFASATTRSSP